MWFFSFHPLWVCINAKKTISQIKKQPSFRMAHSVRAWMSRMCWRMGTWMAATMAARMSATRMSTTSTTPSRKMNSYEQGQHTDQCFHFWLLIGVGMGVGEIQNGWSPIVASGGRLGDNVTPGHSTLWWTVSQPASASTQPKIKRTNTTNDSFFMVCTFYI